MQLLTLLSILLCLACFCGRRWHLLSAGVPIQQQTLIINSLKWRWSFMWCDRGVSSWMTLWIPLCVCLVILCRMTVCESMELQHLLLLKFHVSSNNHKQIFNWWSDSPKLTIRLSLSDTFDILHHVWCLEWCILMALSSFIMFWRSGVLSIVFTWIDFAGVWIYDKHWLGATLRTLSASVTSLDELYRQSE